MVHLLFVHVARADRPNEPFAAPLPKREYNEDPSTPVRFADCLEAFLGLRVHRVRHYGDWLAE
jgi:hypothetical protein